MLRISQVADRLGISPASVRKLCDTGVLASVRPCGPTGHRRIPVDEVDRYVVELSSVQDKNCPELRDVLRQAKEVG